MSDIWKEREASAKARERLIRKFYGADFVGDIGLLRIFRKITKRKIAYHSFMVENAPGRHRARGVSFVSDFQKIPFVKGEFKGLKKSKIYRVSDIEEFANGFISHRGLYNPKQANDIRLIDECQDEYKKHYDSAVKRLKYLFDFGYGDLDDEHLEKFESWKRNNTRCREMSQERLLEMMKMLYCLIEYVEDLKVENDRDFGVIASAFIGGV